MHHLRMHTLHTPCAERAAHWAQINEQFFGHLQVEAMDTTCQMEAQMDVFQLEDLHLYLIDSPAHRVRRDAHSPLGMGDDALKLVLQRKGRARMELGGRHFDLRPGDWSLYDPCVPYSIHNFEAASLLVAQIPRSRLRGLKVPELHTCQAHTTGGEGLSAVMGAFLAALAQQLSSLPDAASQPLGESLLGLLTSTLVSQQAQEHLPLPAVFKSRVRQYVQQHLNDSALSLDQIAQAMRCSKRYLHRVFEDDATTLERYIWQARLERCKAELEAPTPLVRRTIAEVAFANGFRSNAHFCRLFKTEYGVAPSMHRKQHGTTH